MSSEDSAKNIGFRLQAAEKEEEKEKKEETGRIRTARVSKRPGTGQGKNKKAIGARRERKTKYKNKK